MPIKKVSPKIKLIRKSGLTAIAIFTAMGATVPAYATIDNSAVAVGTFGTADDTSSPPDTANVPVLSSRALAIAKSVFAAPSITAGVDNTIIDTGDTIIYRYTITNNGSLTEDNVDVVDVGPTFNGVAGTGTLSAFTEVTGAGAGTGDAATLAPTETVVFEATYTLSALDILNAAGVTDGVSNVASPVSDDLPDGPGTPVSPPAETEIPARTGITIAKAAVLNDEINVDTLAEADETITYTYTVENTGNVALTNVRIDDTHEGALLVFPNAPRAEAITTEGDLQASDLGVADDGVILRLEAGAVATFTYVHTVLQSEVDDG